MLRTRKTSLAFTLLGLFALPLVSKAQTSTPADKAATPATEQDAKVLALRRRDINHDPLRTYRLQAGSSANYGNEVLTALRLMMDPSCRLYLAPEQNVIVLRCAPEYLDIADQVLREIDVPKPNYKLTYTIVESDGSKRLGVQHFVLDAIPGARTTLKDGSKVPVATGSYTTSTSSAQTQFTYLDVGLNFDVLLNTGANGMRLDSKIEQSATTEDRTISGVVEPVVRQAVLTGSATLTLGKPLALGGFDVAGSTRHLEVEVLLEAVK